MCVYLDGGTKGKPSNCLRSVNCTGVDKEVDFITVEVRKSQSVVFENTVGVENINRIYGVFQLFVQDNRKGSFIQILNWFHMDLKIYLKSYKIKQILYEPKQKGGGDGGETGQYTMDLITLWRFVQRTKVETGGVQERILSLVSVERY